jgi:hypothetical protein
MIKQLTPAIVRALLVFAITMVVTIVVVSVSYVYTDDIYSEQQSAKRATQMWKSKINRSVENNQIIEQFESNFLKLVNQGVVGAEDRLSWFETIQNTATIRGMPSVKYSISSQKELLESNIKAEYRGIDVFKSVMTLDIKMAHEGDLFALLNDLEKADGLYAVDSCNIEKINKKVVDSENRMKAYCELGWYTFNRTAANKKQARR